MRHRRHVSRFFLLLIAVTLCGCEDAYQAWPRLRAMVEQSFYPPPPPPAQNQNIASPANVAKPQGTGTAKATAPSAAGTHRTKRKLASAPPPPPAITLQNDSPATDKVHTEAMLAQTKARFASINRNALSSSDTAIYDQAGRFLDAASEALQNDNYSVASGFVIKASLLTNRLAETGSGR